MQGFNRYYPPDFDPKKHDTLNNYHGKHALGDRARKIDKGILVTRFELPFNIWCGSCEAHIGMGVRYNAEKKKVGMYYTTPIYSFRCKCHLCANWFEIRTDPKNTRYVVESGARQKNEDWDEADNGGIVLNRNADGEPADAFSQVEKTTTDKKTALESRDRLEELMDLSESRNSDPFSLSQRLRRSFRKEKTDLIAQARGDDQLKSKYSLPSGLKFIDAGPSSEREELDKAQSLMASHRVESQAKKRRLEAETGPIRTKLSKRLQLDNLKTRLVSSHRRRFDPFLSEASKTTKRTQIIKGLNKSTTHTTPKLQACPSNCSGSSSTIGLAGLEGYMSD